MLIDLHAHSAGISTCCRQPAESIIRTAIELGYDGLVLTNHYHKGYLKDATPEQFARRYLAEYERARTCGDALGFAVWFGIEVTMEQYGGNHLLIYGADFEFLLRYPALYDMSLSELYAHVHAAGGVLIQAHPMRRDRDVRMDPSCLDGVEINCHKGYADGSHLQELADFAAAHELILTCGCDYHADAPRARAGTHLPDSIRNERALAEFLYTTMLIELEVEEPSQDQPRRVRYRRGVGLI